VKRIGKLLCLSVGVVTLLLIGDNINAEVVQEYSSMKDGFSIEVPQGWQIEEREDRASPFIAFRPREKKDEIIFERVYVEVTDAPGRDLNVLYQKHLKEMEKSLPGFTLVSEGDTEINGHNARWLVYTYTDKFITLEVRAKAKQYIVVQGKRAYLITVTARLDTFDEFKGVFQKIIESFRLNDMKKAAAVHSSVGWRVCDLFRISILGFRNSCSKSFSSRV
jgi:hypothetical protein